MGFGCLLSKPKYIKMNFPILVALFPSAQLYIPVTFTVFLTHASLRLRSTLYFPSLDMPRMPFRTALYSTSDLNLCSLMPGLPESRH